MDLRANSAGLDFLVGVGAAAGIFSSVHSSLWSARNFGRDPDTRDSCRVFSWVAAVATIATTGFGSLIARSVWPLLGGLVFTGFMMGGYRYALREAEEPEHTHAHAGGGVVRRR